MIVVSYRDSANVVIVIGMICDNKFRITTSKVSKVGIIGNNRE